MSKIYIQLLGIAAVSIAVTAAFFSIFGLAQLFSGASKAVIFMASTLEFAKLVATGFLYRYWGHINKPVRAYLMGAVAVLMAITSLGIFGFLSNAYQQSSHGWKLTQLKIKALEGEDARIQAQVAEFRRFVDEIPPSRISRKYEFQKIYDPQIANLNARSGKIHEEIAALKLEMFRNQGDIGPILYVAESLGADVDTVVKSLILLFVLVFDPLAVCLVFCWNLAIRLREKYRGDELKIASRTLMHEPVDHRGRKAA